MNHYRLLPRPSPTCTNSSEIIYDCIIPVHSHICVVYSNCNGILYTAGIPFFVHIFFYRNNRDVYNHLKKKNPSKKHFKAFHYLFALDKSET